jgi:hypothetical protein
MAIRTATVLILVAVLLACPFLCLDRVAAGIGEAEKGDCRAEDSCCPSGDSKPGDDCLDKQGSCPESGSCLCHGAIMDRHVTPPTLKLAAASFLP